MRQLPIGETIGIIGGGQLGRMLALAAARLGFQTLILDPFAGCPAAQLANGQIVAAYDDAKALEEMAARTGVITYEFENIPVKALTALAQKHALAPSPQALALAQDRVLEKQFFAECAIPTASWWQIDDADMLLHAVEAHIAREEANGRGNAKEKARGILKTRRLGYDGKGQMRLCQIDKNQAQAAFATLGSVPAIFEGFVSFDCEISVIAARGTAGEVMFFDVPENTHHDGILRRSTVPARIEAQTADQACAYVRRMLDTLGYVGVIAVEFFVLPDGRLLANEFAPRVHNSGHWTEAVCSISQFEQHIRAVSGLPLALPSRHANCIMENLIGDDMAKVGDLLGEENMLIHLYGKEEARPGRKMGHFTRIVP